MKKQNFYTAFGLVAVFVLWTAAISLIDVQPIGPRESSVGFATLNGFVHSLTGVHPFSQWEPPTLPGQADGSMI